MATTRHHARVLLPPKVLRTVVRLHISQAAERPWAGCALEAQPDMDVGVSCQAYLAKVGLVTPRFRAWEAAPLHWGPWGVFAGHVVPQRGLGLVRLSTARCGTGVWFRVVVRCDVPFQVPVPGSGVGTILTTVNGRFVGAAAGVAVDDGCTADPPTVPCVDVRLHGPGCCS
jgi:hypothetical protein